MKNGSSLTATIFSAITLFAAATLMAFGAQSSVSPASAGSEKSYLGFDRNIYPGDDAMKLLRKDFAFTGYWLSPPPGEKTNTWTGKRELLRSLDFGFLILYRGPQIRELQTVWSESPSYRSRLKARAEKRAALDAGRATAAAKKEG